MRLIQDIAVRARSKLKAGGQGRGQGGFIMPTSRTRTATVTMSNSTNKKMASKNTFVTSAGSGNRQGKGETGRRSLAVDPSLMHSSSEGEGEGGLYPEDGSVDANMTKRAHKMNERTAVKSQDIGRSVVDSPRTRRSTRLSGDQLDSGNLITARTVTGAKTSSSYNTEKSGKRKVPPSPVATIHPTPPDTDAEFNEMNMTVHVNSKKSNGSNSKSAITSSSVITNGKKHRTAPAKVVRHKELRYSCRLLYNITLVKRLIC